MYSIEIIDRFDLRRMSEIALADLEDLYVRKPRWAVYWKRLIAVALCQGGALHYLDHKHGLKDIDVWSFFVEEPGQPFPWRRLAHADFGPSKFGRDPKDEGYRGRRIDLLGRSLRCGREQDPAEAIRTWLGQGSKSASFIRQRPVILIWPPPRTGEIIWRGES